MLVSAKVLFLMFAVSGIAAAGAGGMFVDPSLVTDTPVIVDTPMSKAIEIHEDHLDTNSPLPDQAIKGQQTAYDHLMKNWEDWVARKHA